MDITTLSFTNFCELVNAQYSDLTISEQSSINDTMISLNRLNRKTALLDLATSGKTLSDFKHLFINVTYPIIVKSDNDIFSYSEKMEIVDYLTFNDLIFKNREKAKRQFDFIGKTENGKTPFVVVGELVNALIYYRNNGNNTAKVYKDNIINANIPTVSGNELFKRFIAVAELIYDDDIVKTLTAKGTPTAILKNACVQTALNLQFAKGMLISHKQSTKAIYTAICVYLASCVSGKNQYTDIYKISKKQYEDLLTKA